MATTTADSEKPFALHSTAEQSLSRKGSALSGGDAHVDSSKERDSTSRSNRSHRDSSPRGDVEAVANGSDHPKMTVHRFMALVSMAFLWTSAQIPLYLYASIPLNIYEDIGGTDRWIWYITSNLLGLAAVCPFVGALSDLFGRRYVAIIGCLAILIGQGVCAGANDMNTFIAGMAVTGAGAGINELTALAGTAELAPVRLRGVYIAGLLLALVPFMPSTLYAQLIARGSSWRYVSVFTGAWALLGLAITTWFYFPPPRVNSLGLSRVEVLKRVDWIGGFLSIAGITLFCCGLNWGGYMYEWTSGHVLAPLLLGIAVLAAFAWYEAYIAPYPLLPKSLGKAPRTLSLLLFICFISGAQFFSVMMMWPPEAYNVYDHDSIGIGLRGMPFGAGVIIGCIATLLLLTKFRGGSKWLLFGASTIMTAGCGSLAAARVDNINTMYGLLFLAGLGVGALVSPSAIMAQIVCPDEIIATITALTLAVRVVGGAVGWAVYYNVFASKLGPLLVQYVGQAAGMSGVRDPQLIGEFIGLTAGSMLDRIQNITESLVHAPGISPNIYPAIVDAGKTAYAQAYPWVYYVSIAFGGAAMLASLFVEDIGRFMDDHIAVVID